jgi:Protein of unknown function (DUF4238)
VPHDPLADADPAVGGESVHHIVPKVYLRRFADERERITVVDRVTGLRRDAHVDQAHRQKDFYTFVNTDGESDGRVEQLLASVEGQAATALRKTFHPVFGRWPPMGERAVRPSRDSCRGSVGSVGCWTRRGLHPVEVPAGG